MHDNHCPYEQPAGCLPSHCRRSCALEAIDSLLGERGAISGEEMDLLLDLRSLLRRREDAEAALRLFCDLRLRIENRHYLVFFRIRRWLENHLLAAVRSCPAAEPKLIPVKLNHYCVEPIRRVCLCTALGAGSVMLAPRLTFLYRTVSQESASPAAEKKNEALRPA